MNGLFEAAQEVSEFMTERKWKFCLIGGLAVQQWGEPRTTLDADFTLLTGWGEEEPYVDALLSSFESRISDAKEFAMAQRVLLMRASNGRDVDIALGALPFEESMIERATLVALSLSFSIPCCSAEDLFIMKAFAGRPRDWSDAESIVARQSSLDEVRILDQLDTLSELRNDTETPARARTILGISR